MSGVATYAAYAKEGTKNTRETPDHVLAGLTTCQAQLNQSHVMSEALTGRITEEDFVVGNRNPTLNLTTQLVPASMGELWELLLGNNVTAGAGPYTHTGTPADPLATASIQYAVAQETAGTLELVDVIGAMNSDWTVSWDASGDGAMVMLDTNWQCFNLLTDQSAVTNTQPSTARWTSVQTSLTIAAGAYKVKSGNIKGVNPLTSYQEAESTNAGKPTILNGGRRVYTADTVALFEGFTEHDRISAGTEAALVVTVTDATHSWVATMNVRTVGDTVGVGGPGVVEQPLKFVGTSSTSDAAVITTVLTNADAAADVATPRHAGLSGFSTGGRSIANAGPDIMRAMNRIGKSLQQDREQTVNKALRKAKPIHMAAIGRVVGGDMIMSNVGSRKGKTGGRKVNVRYKVTTKGFNQAEGFIRATGPLHLVERDTSGHVIRSAYGSGRGGRRGFIGPTVPGQFNETRRAVINIPGIGYRRSARHPGTKGQAPWEKGRKQAEPHIRKVMRSEVFKTVKDAA